MTDDLGDRMKAYEAVEGKRLLDTDVPIVARIDGRSFSKFTRGFDKPFDTRLTAAMDKTTSRLVDQSHATIGYTQSDEITLVWVVDKSENPEAQMFFNGRVQKLCSVLAGMATVYFYQAITDEVGIVHLDRVIDRAPHFDCRVWNVPNVSEARNTLYWRYLDARKNAVSVFTRQHASHKSMQGLNAEQQLALAEKNGAPPFFEATTQGEREGRFFVKKTVNRNLTDRERAAIPEKHRPPLGQRVTRNEMCRFAGWSDSVLHEFSMEK